MKSNRLCGSLKGCTVVRGQMEALLMSERGVSLTVNLVIAGVVVSILATPTELIKFRVQHACSQKLYYIIMAYTLFTSPYLIDVSERFRLDE
ncbi:hypothetical protein Tco_0660907 [Tanacetum coccineum]